MFVFCSAVKTEPSGARCLDLNPPPSSLDWDGDEPSRGGGLIEIGSLHKRCKAVRIVSGLDE
jgi:hypothetical protein